MVEACSLDLRKNLAKRPWHILFFLNSGYIGGAERIMLLLAERLDRRQFHVTAISLRNGHLIQEMQRRNIEFCVLPLRRPITFFRQFARLIREWEIDLVQTHGAVTELIGALFCRALEVQRVVSTLHDLYSFSNYAKRLFNRLANPFIDRYVSVTEIGCRLAEKHCHIHRHRIELIENSIEPLPARDEERLIALRRYLGANNALLIVTVANLRPVKGHFHVLRAVQSMSTEERQRLIFCFIGADQMNGELQRAAAAMGIADRVIFAGFQTDVSLYLQAADIFLLPSESENMPMAILEALAAGCPVIAADVGGVSEAIDHGRNGLLIEPKSPAAIKEAVLRLAADADFRLRLAANISATAERRFSVDRMVRQYQELYQRLLTEQAGSKQLTIIADDRIL